MLSLRRRFAFGVLALAGMAGLASSGKIIAQDKDKKDDVPDTVLSFPTSDGLAIGAMWYPAKDKQSADAVMMFPRPGGVVNKQMIELAEALQAKGFAVLLFDFRGCGMNGPAPKGKEPLPDPFYLKGRGERILADGSQFFADQFNKGSFQRATVEKVGLNYKTFGDRQKDAIYNDLQAARFFLDRKNDSRVCNTNRIWIVTEKEGYQTALGFIAIEAHRNTIFPEQNVAAVIDPTKAAKDYAGIVAFSPNENSVVAGIQINRGLKNLIDPDTKSAVEHIDRRMAIVSVYGKTEGPGKSKAIVNRWVTGSDDELKRKFKYFVEVDNSKMKGTPTGFDMMDAADSAGIKTKLVDQLTNIAKVGQDFGKDDTKRNASETKLIPRSPVMTSR
ncbi:alpha/beta hydrolase family protein [Zavarzinella formosa]|uniref:hypothetical protein n=1 Tax=Zavarzinella formosa TaxID=360055 RepID=UPI0002F8DC1F|nr:hypothetical protein [Zavarzinella formosa]